MLQVLVGAFLAVLTRWLFEGGVRRRNLHVVRDELEVARLLDPTSELAIELRASADRKLARHLQPSFWARVRAAPRAEMLFLVIGTVVLAAASGVWVLAFSSMLEGKTFAQGLGITGVIGAMAGLGIAAVETFVPRMIDRWVMPIVRRRSKKAAVGGG